MLNGENITIQDASEVDPNLLRMLDRGLEDIESGRTLSQKDAINEAKRIHEVRRQARIVGRGAAGGVI